jgi:di/tricarboxylate transporter
MDIGIVSAILVIALYLFVSERVPVDVTAIAIVVALLATRILTPREAVAGLAHPAVVTVGAMFLISRALVRTGAVEFIGRRILALARGDFRLAMTVILLTVALASAFINNTPVVVLFIPVVLSMSCEFGLSPSKFLIPVSYASILAGTCTLIGTSTNIIVSDLSLAAGHGAIGMFELGLVGLPIAVVGLAYLLLVAPRLLPALGNPVCELQDSGHKRYLAELAIPRGSRLVGQSPVEVFQARYPSVEVLELIRYSHIYHPPRDPVTISPGDLLLIKGSATDLVEILHEEGIELPRAEKGLSFGVTGEAPVVVELMVVPGSSLQGKRLVESELMKDPDFQVIALKRTGLHYTEKQLGDARLRTGDMVLLWGPAAKLERLRAEVDAIVIEDVHQTIVLKRRAWKAMSIFIGLVLAATTGLADIMTCALTGALLMILTGCLQMRDAYKALQGDVLLLIAGTIALGTAMEHTGTSRLYAEAVLRLLEGASPEVILGGVILLTSVSTQIISNNATAVLLFPIAVSVAAGLGVSPKPFILAVCFGASACYATPIGYQTNLLVYGPGGYRFSDFFKLGLPLNLLVLVLGTLLIPRFWPF